MMIIGKTNTLVTPRSPHSITFNLLVVQFANLTKYFLRATTPPGRASESGASSSYSSPDVLRKKWMVATIYTYRSDYRTA